MRLVAALLCALFPVAVWAQEGDAGMSSATHSPPPHPMRVEPGAPPLVMTNPAAFHTRMTEVPDIEIDRAEQGCRVTLAHPSSETRLLFYISNVALGGAQLQSAEDVSGDRPENGSALILLEPLPPSTPLRSSSAAIDEMPSAVSMPTYHPFVVAMDGRPYQVKGVDVGDVGTQFYGQNEYEQGWRGWGVRLDDSMVGSFVAEQNIEVFYPSGMAQSWTLTKPWSSVIAACTQRKPPVEGTPRVPWHNVAATASIAEKGPYEGGGPQGNPGNWIGADDYPPAALQEEREGTAILKIQVSPYAFVRSCEVVKSSGWKDLDRAACRSVFRRAHFAIATDDKDKMIGRTYRLPVRWSLPEDGPED